MTEKRKPPPAGFGKGAQGLSKKAGTPKMTQNCAVCQAETERRDALKSAYKAILMRGFLAGRLHACFVCRELRRHRLEEA